MRSSHLFTAVVSLASISAAWPWPPNFEAGKAMQGIEGLLFRRQDNSQSQSATRVVTSSNSASRTASPTQTSGTASRSGSGTATGKDSTITSAPTGSFSSNSTDNSTSFTTDYDPRLPAGGVSMLTPNQLLGPTYYKVGDWVTFAWNYTSLQATPTAVNVFASCSGNGATYTLASNMSVASTNKILWDTNATPASNFLTAQYTLIIMDANSSSVTEAAKPGYLAVQRTFQFGMYLKQAYTPWADFNCATCNAAFGSHERLTVTFLAGMVTLSFGSFLWFASGFGVF